MDPKKILRQGVVLVITLLLCNSVAGAQVDFPGPSPGVARAATHGGVFKLDNSVISRSWRLSGATLAPDRIENKLTHSNIDESGTELFRISLSPPKVRSGAFVGIRLENHRVVALASNDGSTWTELGAFPRSEFPGPPNLVRLGKMNLRGQALNYAGGLGASGTCKFSDLNLSRSFQGPSSFELSAGANQGMAKEFPFPSDSNFVSCHIDKGTDQGMSWSPAISLVWNDGKTFLLVGVRDSTPVFNLTTSSGENIVNRPLPEFPSMDLLASDFRLAQAPKILDIAGDRKGVRLADRIHGKALEATFSSKSGIRARWRAELRDGSSYIRQTLEITSPTRSISVYGLELTDVKVQDPQTVGAASGCPVAAGGMFFGVELPGAQNALTSKSARIGFACRLAVEPTQSYTFGSVVGVAAENQLRRSFLFYLERERARPSSPFLHYNCWYDLGFSADAEKILDVVRSFDRELVMKRGVPVQSYLIDDGWDDPSLGLWREDPQKYPGGFPVLRSQVQPLGGHLGIWISPLGGYGYNEERTADAQHMGLIPAGSPLDLAYPRYKAWFQDRCLELMRKDGVNLFKWDRAGNGVSPHFMALLEVGKRLRKENPNVFINVTVGTWPSPFWLNFIDCTWRTDSPGDVGWAGKGLVQSNPYDREKWLTFRDGYCHECFVVASPLYPLNSQMLHGIVYGRNFQGGSIGQSNPPDLKNEARSYFGNGAMLQELYLTPSMMTPSSWDQVAEAAKWAHANADVLMDSHWVGGDPLALQPYGFAAWNKRKGTLMLRNPDHQVRTIGIDAGSIFELPKGAARSFALKSPYPDQRLKSLRLTAGQPLEIRLDPFEVLVFDAFPQEAAKPSVIASRKR